MAKKRRFAFDELNETIHSRFVRIASAYPDRLAVVGRQAKLTYAQLDSASDAVCSAVESMSGGVSKPVSVIMPQGVQATAAILGVLKAGCFYVPLDTDVPADWARGVLLDVAPAAVLTDTESFDHVAALVPPDVRVLDVGEICGAAHSNSSRSAPDDASHGGRTESSSAFENGNRTIGNSDDLVYVYFTSGTTGAPKGVMDTHRNVLHNVMRYTNALSIAPEDGLTLLQSIGFSGSVSSLFCALLNGATSYPIDMRRETGASLAEWIVENDITIYHSVPSIFRSITTGGDAFPSVRIVRLEGDAASVRDLDRFREAFVVGSRLVNGLGLTETGIVCQHFMDHDSRLDTDVVPVGHPCEGVSIEILDEDGQPAPTGQVGEIAIDSRYLAPGYWKQPVLTDAVFSRPSGNPGLRRYLTGDLGRMTADGVVEHLGRTDGRIRLGGHWIEPFVIENAIVEMPGIAEAVVVMKTDASDHPRLIAYLVRSGALISVAEVDVRRHLRRRFPDVMIPSRHVFLDRLPLTSNGKIDRDALPPPGRSRPDLGVEYTRPVGSLQQRLSELWSEVLAIDGIGVHDDFFDLGGDSLQAITMLGKVEQSINRRLSPDVLLSGATIEHMADALVARESELHDDVVLLQPRGGGLPFFFLHGDYVSGGFYSLELARRMGEDRPFYAVRPRGLGGEPVPESYAKMAEQHIEAIKAVQPKGPYLIGGLCNGGLAAFEMVRLLKQQGEEVSMLVMVDSTAINLQFERWRKRLSMLKWMGLGKEEQEWVFRRIRAIGVEVPSGSPLLAARALGKRLSRKFRRVTSEPVKDYPASLFETGSRSLPKTVAGYLREYRGAYMRADQLYIPSPYDGPVVLLWPADKADESVDEARSLWTRVCPQIDVRAVPGDMITSHTRYIGDLADAIRACLVDV